MDFMEFEVANSIVAQGAATGMGVDKDGQLFYVLRVHGFNSSLEKVSMHIVIPPDATEMFIRIVNSIGAQNEKSV